MDKIVHFEIPADDLERAKEFYEEVFGWHIEDVPEMDYTMLHTGPTDKKGMVKEKGFINGGMFKRNKDVKNVTITIDVDDIDESIEKIESNGGEVIKGKMDVGDMGYVAYFKDSEGNLIGLWETKNSE